MTTRWDSLPEAMKAKVVRKAPRAPARGRFRCAGPRGCGEILTCTWAAMERHLDGHGGGRAEAVLE